MGEGLLHLHKVGQEEDDLHVVVGQVPAAADPLSALHVRPTQEHHRGALVHVFGVQSGGGSQERGGEHRKGIDHNSFNKR